MRVAASKIEKKFFSFFFHCPSDIEVYGGVMKKATLKKIWQCVGIVYNTSAPPLLGATCISHGDRAGLRDLTMSAALTPQRARAGILRGGSRGTTGQERYRIAV